MADRRPRSTLNKQGWEEADAFEATRVHFVSQRRCGLGNWVARVGPRGKKRADSDRKDAREDGPRAKLCVWGRLCWCRTRLF
jgi:hypothetical protein